ncbi:filamentous hemagglutinin N-terminal domain-containing protein [Aliinostoc sp. HNIBRCY26]|uniref:filamentous hemagglutinin N-terminal domain-containing protein n=1 Tax=Aliinostoc sp. HNIBRCY26 TaxID=3418997 RepID=UPI003D00940C
MKVTFTGFGLVGGMFISIIGSSCVNAQVIPDSSLGTDVSESLNHVTITHGNRVGNNLFHSFEQFSIPSNGSAFFDNASDIQNIFSRVTGGSVSQIDGLIQANGSANLFLLNPNGIIFGPNARLNIGGSFVGTTADSINFSDGFIFSTTNTTTPSLLTMSVPIGLQIGQNSGSIEVQGQGHNLLHPPNFLAPVTRDPQLGGLRLFPGQTLALLGNGIKLDAGVLIAESGHIELGSMAAGTVHLNTNTPTWEFGYHSGQSLSDIYLTRAALIDTSGNPGGSIHLQGKDIHIQNSSSVFIQHQGQQRPGSIKINADLLAMSSVLPQKNPSLILSENLSSGYGANIEVSARQLIVQDGGGILSTTYTNGGQGGNITVKSAESIQIIGFSPINFRASSISSPSFPGSGKGGNIAIATKDLLVKEGGAITSLVEGGGSGGNIDITADTISIFGENPGSGGASAIATSTFFGGDGGVININTRQLILRASGVISASTSDTGNAGDLTIYASESVEIDGSNSVLRDHSRITASGQRFRPRYLQNRGLSAFPSGNGGNLTIISPSIKVSNEGYIAAENIGSGNGGYLQIQTDSLLLEQQGQIRTSAASGQGGSLGLTVGDVLLMRHNSLISARAGNNGNGGNITIISPVIVGLENSDIIANAIAGNGGKIQITTQGLLGLEFRNELTPENDISASSQFGLSGTVQINNVGVDPNSGLVELPENVTDPSQQIATGCADAISSSFIATGRGGIPENPTQGVRSDRTWSDIRDISAFPNTPQIQAQTSQSPQLLVQATSWHRNAQGKVELVAISSLTPNPSPLPCTAISQK